MGRSEGTVPPCPASARSGTPALAGRCVTQLILLVVPVPAVWCHSDPPLGWLLLAEGGVHGGGSDVGTQALCMAEGAAAIPGSRKLTDKAISLQALSFLGFVIGHQKHLCVCCGSLELSDCHATGRKDMGLSDILHRPISSPVVTEHLLCARQYYRRAAKSVVKKQFH